MKLCFIIGLTIATIVTLISVFVGILIAPGVFFTMGGGLFGVSWPPQTSQYVMQVFLSFFVSSLVACYATLYITNKNT